MDQSEYKVKFISLGGIVGVTKNMYVYEIHKNGVLEDVLIVDCGIGFPKEAELGVDFVIPDVSYLQDKTDKIKAILLSHGHEDHIGGLPYNYKALGRPKIYTSKLTKMFVENKFKEFSERADVTLVEYRKTYTFGNFQIEFIPVTHSIPDTMHLLIKTPVGTIYHGTDFKLDLTPPYGTPPDFYRITKAGEEGVLCMMSDALGSEREGLTLSEAIVGQTFEDEMRKTKGKFMMTTFSSNISRIRQCVEAAIKFNRKIVFLGRSMRENTKLAGEIGYLPIPQTLTTDEKEVMRLPPNKVCIIAAGSQGQFGSALSKLAHNRNKFVKIKPGDKVIFSSDPIPGNENEVYSLIEELAVKGADVVYSDIHDQLHASGHGNQEDLKFLIRFVKPRYLMPIGSTLRHQRQYQRLAGDLGYEKNNVLLLDEGETVWFTKGKAQPGEEVETKNIYVDSYGVGEIGNAVLRDRKTLSSDGIVIAILTIDQNSHLTSRPRIISKGFVFEKTEEQLFTKAMMLIEKEMKSWMGKLRDVSGVRRDVINTLENYFVTERGKRPLIAVDIIEI